MPGMRGRPRRLDMRIEKVLLAALGNWGQEQHELRHDGESSAKVMHPATAGETAGDGAHERKQENTPKSRGVPPECVPPSIPAPLPTTFLACP